MRLTSLALLSSGLVFALVACRGESSKGDVDAPVGGSVRIQDIQDPGMPVGTQVEVHDVVITAIDAYGARTGDLWVQDPAGGPFSGIKVFGVPLDQLGALAPGDVVTITNAQKEEFACSAMICGGSEFPNGNSITELEGAGGGTLTVTKTGTGTASITTVDAFAIEMLPTLEEREAEWEKWEGVLITATKLRQTSGVTAFGMALDQKKFTATGGIEVQSLLADLGAAAVAGVCYQGVTGIGDYFFTYKLLPRTTADLVGGGTGCATQTSTTVASIQMGASTGPVALVDVFVTGRDDIGTTTKGVWVSDALQAAAHNSVLVFTGSTMSPATVEIGAKINVVGTVKEFDLGSPPVGDTLTEIDGAAVTFVAAPVAMPTPLTGVTVATLADIGAPGEPYEGALVQLSNMKVTNLNAGLGKVELTDNNGAKLIMDNESFNWTAPALNDCFSTLVGLMHVQVNDNVRTINPRAVTDMVVGVGCN